MLLFVDILITVGFEVRLPRMFAFPMAPGTQQYQRQAQVFLQKDLDPFLSCECQHAYSRRQTRALIAAVTKTERTATLFFSLIYSDTRTVSIGNLKER